VVSIEGEVDIHNAAAAQDALCSGPPAPLVIDLTRCAFLDSSGIRALVAAERTLDGQGPPVLVCSPGNPALGLLELAGVDALYQVLPTIQEGVAAASEPDTRSNSLDRPE
jgi:anti-anti-sigma factor